jgi:hypothetical protein
MTRYIDLHYEQSNFYCADEAAEKDAGQEVPNASAGLASSSSGSSFFMHLKSICPVEPAK